MMGVLVVVLVGVGVAMSVTGAAEVAIGVFRMLRVSGALSRQWGVLEVVWEVALGRALGLGSLEQGDPVRWVHRKGREGWRRQYHEWRPTAASSVVPPPCHHDILCGGGTGEGVEREADMVVGGREGEEVTIC